MKKRVTSFKSIFKALLLLLIVLCYGWKLECARADEQGRATDQIFRLMAEMNAPIRMMNEEKDGIVY